MKNYSCIAGALGEAVIAALTLGLALGAAHVNEVLRRETLRQGLSLCREERRQLVSTGAPGSGPGGRGSN